MQEYKILYLAEVDTPTNPAANYRKLYPKADGWYTLDSDGNEVRIEGIIIVDENGIDMPQKQRLQFAPPFYTYVDGEQVKVSLFPEEDADTDADADFMFMHGNEFHSTPFATEEEFDAHLSDPSPHDINMEDLHTPNTDLYLDQGGENEVSAEDLRDLLDSTQGGVAGRYTAAEVLVSSEKRVYLAAATTNHVKFVLPAIADSVNMTFTFRLAEQAMGYAMNVERSGMDIIMWNNNNWEGITTDDIGTWFTVQNDGTKWYVVTDSGLTELNEI